MTGPTKTRSNVHRLDISGRAGVNDTPYKPLTPPKPIPDPPPEPEPKDEISPGAAAPREMDQLMDLVEQLMALQASMADTLRAHDQRLYDLGVHQQIVRQVHARVGPPGPPHLTVVTDD